MVDSISILNVRIAGTNRLELDFSTGETIALLLPPELGLDANHWTRQPLEARGSNGPCPRQHTTHGSCQHQGFAHPLVRRQDCT